MSLGGPDSRCQFVLDTQDRADASFRSLAIRRTPRLAAKALLMATSTRRRANNRAFPPSSASRPTRPRRKAAGVLFRGGRYLNDGFPNGVV